MTYISFRIYCECNVMNDEYHEFLIKYLKREWKTSTQLGCRLRDKDEIETFNFLVEDWKNMVSLYKNKWVVQED